jgi:hypothetical protein
MTICSLLRGKGNCEAGQQSQQSQGIHACHCPGMYLEPPQATAGCLACPALIHGHCQQGREKRAGYWHRQGLADAQHQPGSEDQFGLDQ